MTSDHISALTKGMALGWQYGSVSVPYHLLCYYNQLQLTETEVMLLIQLIGFKQQEMKYFPTIDELQERMVTTSDVVMKSLHKLMKSGFINIDEAIDPDTNIQYERYNVTGLWEKLAACVTKDRHFHRQHVEEPLGEENPNLFHIFEKEFGRPLSPMECETITGWIEQDRYAKELILLALKEAVFAGKVYLRYIDRILLDWARNRVRSIEEAKAYTQKFRETGPR